MAVEDSVQSSVPVVVNNQFHVDIEFSSADFALSIDDFSDRFIKPAMATIANKVDATGLALVNLIPNATGNTAALADQLRMYLDAGARLDSEAAPRDGQRAAVIGPYTQAGLVDNLKGLFQSSDQIKNQYESGNMGLAAGLKFSMDQNVFQHINGTGIGSPVIVAGAGQSGGTLTTSGLVGILNAGDTFTIAGVYAVNPQTRTSTGKLKQFVVAATTAANATVLTILPAIVGPATPQFQNVTALPANSAALTFVGTASQALEYGVVFHKDAFTLVCADLPLPTGDSVEAARVSDEQLGLSIRMVRQYIIATDTFPCRLDILFGWAILYPELACKVYSNTQ